MPGKKESIIQLAAQTACQISTTGEAYMAFLTTAARNFKYCFRDQLLIYAQKPEATACASIDFWNQYGRWVNQGTTGIALLVDTPAAYKLRYVFDMSDTNSRAGRTIPIWQMKPQYEEVVIETLKNSYGELREASNFTTCLLEIAKILVEDTFGDYDTDLWHAKKDSLLEELDHLNIKQWFTELLEHSIAFILLTRCGIDPKAYFSGDDFTHIYEFNTPETLSILGAAVSDISEMPLREISTTVLRLYWEEQKQHHTFAKRLENRYNDGKTSHRERGERRNAHGNDISDRKWISVTQSGGSGSTERREIRDVAAQLPSKIQDGDLHRDAAFGQAGQPPAGNQSEGERDGRVSERTNGSGAGRERSSESSRSTYVGGQDEQHQSGSRRNRDGRADLQLNQGSNAQTINEEAEKEALEIPQDNLLPIEERRQAIQTAEEEVSSAVFILPETIDTVLRYHNGISTRKFHIYEQFMKQEGAVKNAEFLEKEYGIGGVYPLIPAQKLNLWHDAKGITISIGGVSKPDVVVRLPWNKVEKRIGELIKTGHYLSQEEQEAYLSDSQQAQRDLPSEPPKEHQITEGATVYLGMQEYKLLAFDDQTVRLFDPALPIINKELPRGEFNRLLAENPLNDKLIQITEEATSAVETVQDKIELMETENGYAVGDDIQGGIYVDNEGIQEEFTSEWQVQDYLKQAKQDVADKEFTEQAKQELITKEDEIDTESSADGLASDNIEPMLVPTAPRQRIKESPFVLHPEISNTDRHEYRITDDAIGVGTPGERFNSNIRAIRLLKRLELEDRLATPEEQEVLAQYVGWGGLADCFDERHSKYTELKALLSEDEYAAARESTLTAFYTPPIVIRTIYQVLENMGFQTGNILEPSCGIGNFIGMCPKALAGSNIYGIELDSISGRMAQQLYQKASIAVQGFETTDLPDSFFDVAIGNVPFGNFKLSDKRYDKHNFLIHDYFFARTLDKVRPGGIIAYITSKGTMDKENPNVRKYIAQRAELLGAIRLPNNTFKDAAGTEVTSDILFLKKRDTLSSEEPVWVHRNTDDGLPMNQYFIDHPEMVLGEMKKVSGPYGPETACLPYAGQDLNELLAAVIPNIQGSITEYVLDDPEAEGEDKSIPADLEVRNFSYTVVNGQVYYRENSRMHLMEVSVTTANRIRGLIDIRECVRRLITYQVEDWPIEDIKAEQRKLNVLYDRFCKKYGRIHTRANQSAFGEDSSYFLLSSLEIMDHEGNFLRKADMFFRRTIKQRGVITSVDTASEALSVSLAEKAKVDMAFMMKLTGKTEQEIYTDLAGVIFRNPMHGYGNSAEEKYLSADEYLSGNVREKLEWARRNAEQYPEDYTINVHALEQVQPVDLTASEISVRLGATWIPPKIVEQFVFELFDTPKSYQWNIHVHYSKHSNEWNIEGKSYDKENIKSQRTYGTDRIHGYRIVEETLNLRNVRIFDYVSDEDGIKTAILNKKETAIAQSKQELIKQEFQDWIWKDPQRRERLTRLYNDTFNSVRPREYDGSHLNFVGMNPEITLRPHQVNAIAHILYGGNTLLAHVVGAGKTFEMVAAAQESKRLGLCQKSLFVVPNHLTEQWAAEYLQLYSSANILVATKKDFETKNRKRFCGRIATGDYDAIIIGHSQFEKIPMSVERHRYLLAQQRQEILDGIAELKAAEGDRFSIKQMERVKKTIDAKLDKLNDQSRKDDVVTFEELGVDRIFIDEAHYYKNLAVLSKMRNVGGISQTEAQKSSDLYMKCRYLDEITGGRGVIFATGTPISNTMVELYTMQKYLQYHTLQKQNLLHFDAWASTFGETVTAIELAPEGNGYRAKTRFARFYNLPELMSMFKEVADIQTAEMLKLPVPKANYHNIVLKPSEQQKEMVKALGERAERVRNQMVDSSKDNMLLITNDGRKLALDQRLLNPMLPDSDTSKITTCAELVFAIWQRTIDQRSTQMVFCDLSTPKGNGEFNVYDDLRDKLITKGMPAEEISYIHTANTEMQKKELFGKVRSGQVRVLLGSTQKMGAGTNVQQKLVALHHLDCPWRPSDLQQREGRIIRQGNTNPEVEIYTYVTENTFDSYLYQMVEGKQKFIGQVMTNKSPVRSAEDVDETALSYAEIKALCTGNPYIKEKMDLDIVVQRLKLLKANHLSQKYSLEDQILKKLPQKIADCKQKIANYRIDQVHLEKNTTPGMEGFCPMEVEGVTYTEKKDAGAAILAACKAMTNPDAKPLGYYRGFFMELSFDTFSKEYKVTLKNRLNHTAILSADIFGNIKRIDNTLNNINSKLNSCEEQLEEIKVQLVNARAEVGQPFPQEEELKAKTIRLEELNILLNMDKRENAVMDEKHDAETNLSVRKTKEQER